MTNKQTFIEQKNLFRKKYPHLTEEQLDELTRRGFLKGLGAAAATYGGVSLTNSIIDEVREGKKRFITIKRGDSKADVLQKMGDIKPLERIKGSTGSWGTSSTWKYNGIGDIKFTNSKVNIIDYVNTPLNKYEENKAQQDLLNQLNEYRQTQQLDEIGDFTKAITKKIGQGVGAVQGAGQKVKGVAKRSVDALGKSFQQGKQQTQKAVAGQDYKASQPKAQAQTQIQKPGLLKRAAGAVQTGIGKADALAQKTLDKVDDVTSYNWQSGLPDRSQQTYTGVGGASIGKNAQSGSLTQRNQAAGMAAKLQKTDAEAQRKAGLEKKLGTTGTQASAANQDQKAIQKSIARNQKKQGQGTDPISQAMNKGKTSAVKQGMNQANDDWKKRKPSYMTGTPKSQQDKQSTTPQRDSTGKIVSTTAKDVAQKTKVPTAKIGGQKLDLNDPKMAGLRAAIEKASPGTLGAIDKLDAPSKQKLKKAIA